jgi:PAS domain S-box-containing protein
MNHSEFQLRAVGDPRLARHAASALPAWLWSTDGTKILWANPAGAKFFGATNSAALAAKIFGPADQHRRQVAQLANRLPPNGAVRLERLRGFGAGLGTLATCGCARLDFADGSHGVLVTAADTAGRFMPLAERLQRLVEGIDAPVASFDRDGALIGASNATRSLLGFRDLAEAGLAEARDQALQQGRAERRVGSGHLVLQRVGSGADVGLIAVIEMGEAATDSSPSPLAGEGRGGGWPQALSSETPTPDPSPQGGGEQNTTPGEALAGFTLVNEFAEEPAAPVAAPDYEAPSPSGEAPAEFALIDAFAVDQPVEPSPDAAIESAAAEAVSEEAIAETIAEAVAPENEDRSHEPSPYIEAVADEPAPAPEPTEPPPAHLPAWLDEAAVEARKTPLRFMWQMDADGRFTLGSDEFTGLIGARTAAGLGRPWRDIAASFGLDPEGRVLTAFATHDTWSGITLNWPVDGGEHLPVELSGLPLFDRAQNFAGYRGFGVCRDLDALARLAALRRHEFYNPPPRPLSADIVPPEILGTAPSSDAAPELFRIAPETSQPTDLETAVEIPQESFNEAPKNVLPFRPISEPKSPGLTAVENSAFNELARQLAERLERENSAAAPPPAETAEPTAAMVDPPAPAETHEIAAEQPSWLMQAEPPARGEGRRDRALLDLLPVGVLIYRLDRLVYANAAFLARMGYSHLHALEEAGGLDALYVEPGVSTASSTSDTGTPVTISATQDSVEHTLPAATEARLYTISWDGEQALALIFSHTGSADVAAVLEAPVSEPISEPVLETVLETVPEPSPVGHANAEELGAILDTTAEGIVMFDAEGNINSANRSAEALFGHDGAELVQRNLTDLFAPESAQGVKDYLASVKGAEFASLLEQGRDLLARERGGGLIPVSMTMGRTQPSGPNFFAVFRDLSQAKKSESELREARRMSDRAANAKGDLLARISHEVRTPLNAIIGFAEVMIGERFGALGNERYIEYMKDIRASGERVIAIINDLLDLSRIETGKLDLAFTSQNLNDLVEQCVAVMQPQANRERIIIRTSLAHMLPQVTADARALRQITLNLIGTSIHLANAGGQVIVSTALSDFGEVVLRVRDTGHGLNDNEVAAAMEPFRTPAPSDQAADSSGVSLSLTKALVEANRARFQIKTGGSSGTLIEVLFPHAMARA